MWKPASPLDSVSSPPNHIVQRGMFARNWHARCAACLYRFAGLCIAARRKGAGACRWTWWTCPRKSPQKFVQKLSKDFLAEGDFLQRVILL